MEDQRLPRRERERLRQRQEMKSAALGLFSAKGYHNVSMAEIAEKAEFAIGTLYKFFKNKEELYKALMLEQADKFYGTLTKAIDEPDDEIEKLRNYVRAKGDLFRADIAVVRLYFSETRGASFTIRDFYPEIRTKYERFLRILASIFEVGIKRKRFKKIADPYYLALAMDGLVNAFLFQWMEAPERHPSLEDPDTILNILFHGLADTSGAGRFASNLHDTQ